MRLKEEQQEQEQRLRDMELKGWVRPETWNLGPRLWSLGVGPVSSPSMLLWGRSREGVGSRAQDLEVARCRRVCPMARPRGRGRGGGPFRARSAAGPSSIAREAEAEAKEGE
jgi:hypothetical protein